MNELAERAIKILDHEGITNPVLERKTGIKQENWKSVRYRRTRFNQDHIQAIGKLWPQYSLWLVTGNLNDLDKQTQPNEAKQ